MDLVGCRAACGGFLAHHRGPASAGEPVTTDKDGNVHLAYTFTNNDEAGRPYGELKTILNHTGMAAHIDALCHVIFDGELYNGVTADTVTEAGAAELSMAVAADGIVGRGVLV